MKFFVVLGHQRPGSFCHAIADTVKAELESAGHEVISHDLYEEGFDPILPEAEIPKGSPAAEMVEQHCHELAEADGIVVVHPNWWAQPPAILKGWVDRVFRQGQAYDFIDGKIAGFWGDKRVVVFTTSNTPREVELEVYGDPLQNLWETCIFGFCGVTNFLRRNFESMVMSTPEERAGWLEEVKTIVKERLANS